MAFVLRASGMDRQSQSLLEFLFANEGTGEQAGAYPDKWAYRDPDNPWACGNPSVLRTSLVFWMLSSLAVQDDSPENGVSRPCLVTPADCNAAFRELGQCDAGYAGEDIMIDGIPTGCLDLDAIRYDRDRHCAAINTCYYDPENDVSDVTFCAPVSVVKCIGTACTDSCVDAEPLSDEVCMRRWVQGDTCGAGGRAGELAASPVAPPGARSALRIEGLRPNPLRGRAMLFFTVERAGPVRLEIFDVVGRRICARLLGEPGPGAHVVPVGDEGGAMLPAGVYRVRLTQGGLSASAQAVVVR